jgi:hypothetical protein
MDHEYSHDRIPEKLIKHLQAAGDERRFRRRFVVTKGDDRWELVCCTVEGFLPGEALPDPVAAWRYPQALLSEDFLTGNECLRFAEALHAGDTVAIEEGIQLLRNQDTHWRTEMVSVTNDHMSRAGHVISVQFTQRRASISGKALITPEAPYFPEIDTAACAWLPFPVYHGHSDSRNDQVIFLLPETRAFIANASLSGNGTIDITVAGTEAGRIKLLVKGAHWRGKRIDHIHELVVNGKATLTVPTDAERIEYYLIDESGLVYDFHREDQYSRLGPGRSKLATVRRSLADQVREACFTDEGLHVEFKPFIAPEQKLGTPDQKTKLREIVKTVVAFANTEGGRLYLGIEDDCTISGINSELQSWIYETFGNRGIDDSAIANYLSALKSRIKEAVSGDTLAQLAHVRMGDAIVVIVEVPKASRRPLTIQDDYYLYVRIGNKTRKLSPDQWANFLLPDRSL